MKHKGFSLVEMLMALLVASLLMVALAPVITKKFSENLSISSIGGTRADYKRTWYYDPAKEYHEWSVPNGVNVIKVTAIGGGGAGGGSSYGYHEFTEDTKWTVPEGVYKLRVFMTGAGGAGAAGGAGSGTVYVSFPGNDDWTLRTPDFTTLGETTTPYAVPSANRAPRFEDDEESDLCRKSGTSQWTLVDSATKEVILDEDNKPIMVNPGEGGYIKVTACGAGGGGGGKGDGHGDSGGGGSGGYIADKTFTYETPAIYIRISGGGGGGGSWGQGYRDGNKGGYYSGGGGGGTQPNASSAVNGEGGQGGEGGGGKGGKAAIGANAGDGEPITLSLSDNRGQASYNNGKYRSGYGGYGTIWAGGGGGGASVSNASGGWWGGGGGGGGGPTSVTAKSGSSSRLLVQAGGGGGGGGGGDHNSYPDLWAGGSGGGGGGYGGGGGGAGGSKYKSGEESTGATFLNILIGGSKGNSGRSTGNSYGAGGGGGAGGSSGCHGNTTETICGNVTRGGGVISGGIFATNTYCSGGAGSNNATVKGENGKQGALRLWYGKKSPKVLMCSYTQKANGGGGGGAGQIWFGEINVIPGQRLDIKIGKGGSASAMLYGAKGGDGGPTSIDDFEVAGGQGGSYSDTDSETEILKTAGTGYRYKETALHNWAMKDDKWSTALSNAGKYGIAAQTIAGGARGGAGGSTINRFGEIVDGGTRGDVQEAGGAAGGYGAGGGGGGGVTESGKKPGYGADGGKGYVYLEWGEKNGGGGASGQVITQESVWVTPGTIVKIYAGKGGTAKALTAQTYTDSGVTKTQGYKGEDGEDGGDTYLIVKDASAEKKVGIAKGGKGGLAGGKDHGRGGGIKTDASGNYDPNNIQPEIENTTPGETATDEKGGMGGTIDEVMCPLLTELKKVGLGGCGGNTTTAGSCQNSVLVSGEGVNAGGLGNGGGGGAVVEKVPFKGGNGSGGMVTIEWSN